MKQPMLAVRVLALAAALFLLVYPVRAFLLLDGVPLGIRLAWPVAAVAAALAPRASLFGFLAGASLLPVMPFEMEWPRASLAEVWLFALLIPAWLRFAAGTAQPRMRVPMLAPIFFTLATASLLVSLYPFQLVSDGVRPLLALLHEFLWSDALTLVSQRHIYASVLAWAILVEGLALLWLMVAVLGDRQLDGSVKAAIAAGAGATLVAAYGIRQWWTGKNLLEFWLIQDPEITRINSTFTDVNGLGAYLGMMIWIVIPLAHLAPDRRWRWAWRAAAAAIAVAMLFTGSRAAWFAAAIGALAYVVGLWRFGLLKAGSWPALYIGRFAAAGTLTAVIILGALTAYATAQDVRYEDQRSYLDTLLYTLNLNTPAEQRLKGRVPLWEAGARMVEERPVFGIGIGRYYKEVYAYSSRREALIRPQENAHNYFLQVAAELGLSGLICFAALLVVAVALALRVARRRLPPEVCRLALGAAVGIVVFSLASVTGHPLLVREGQFAFWPIVGLAVLLAEHAREPAAESRETGRSRWWRRPGVLVWTASGLVLASIPTRAIHEARSVDLTRIPFGLYDTEVGSDGRAFRWSAAKVVIHAPPSATTFEIPIRSLAPFAQTIMVRLDGQPADQLLLNDHAWHKLRYVLPRRKPGDSSAYRIELVVQPPWRPVHDRRRLGVMTREFRWTN